MTKARVNIGKVAMILLCLIMIALVFVACVQPKLEDNKSDDNQSLSAPKINVESGKGHDMIPGQTATFRVEATHELQDNDSYKDKMYFEFKIEYKIDDGEYQELEVGDISQAFNQSGKSTFQFHADNNDRGNRKIDVRLTVLVKIGEDLNYDNKDQAELTSEATEFEHTLMIYDLSQAPNVDVDVVVE